MDVATLLIVDDIAENREVLSRRLERRGYLMEFAADGQSALDTVSSQSIDLVLLDIMLPDMSGLDVLKKIRETFTRIELPVIMVSAKNESFDMVEALNIGANDYVTKPVDFSVAVARIDTHLKIKNCRPAGVSSTEPGAVDQSEEYGTSPSAVPIESK